MDILLQSDGQLYPPRHADRRTPKPEPKKEKPAPQPVPGPEKKTGLTGLPWEEFLLMAVAFIIIKSDDHPDIPLLLALAYILFDQKFSLKDLF